MVYRNLILASISVAACGAACAQAPEYGLGRTPTAVEVQAWSITIGNDGAGLPAGKGTAVEGGKIYQQKCAACHGKNGNGGLAPELWKSTDPAEPSHQRHFFPTQPAYATVLWDYIHRAMPLLTGPGTLKPDEVYALTAYLLFQNDVIKESDVLDAQTLPKIKMPNRDVFVAPIYSTSLSKPAKAPKGSR